MHSTAVCMVLAAFASTCLATNSHIPRPNRALVARSPPHRHPQASPPTHLARRATNHYIVENPKGTGNQLASPWDPENGDFGDAPDQRVRPVDHPTLYPHASAEHHARFHELLRKHGLARERGATGSPTDPEVRLLRAHRVDRNHLYGLARYRRPADFEEVLHDTAKRRFRNQLGMGLIGGVAGVGFGGFWGNHALQGWCGKHHKTDGVCKIPNALHM